MTKNKNELKNLTEKESKEKLKELKAELIKSKANTSKTGNSKSREIRKMIARIHTFNKSKLEELNTK